jgi:hypothetical protein
MTRSLRTQMSTLNFIPTLSQRSPSSTTAHSARPQVHSSLRSNPTHSARPTLTQLDPRSLSSTPTHSARPPLTQLDPHSLRSCAREGARTEAEAEAEAEHVMRWGHFLLVRPDRTAAWPWAWPGATPASPRTSTAQARNHRFAPLSALRAHPNAP